MAPGNKIQGADSPEFRMMQSDRKVERIWLFQYDDTKPVPMGLILFFLHFDLWSQINLQTTPTFAFSSQKDGSNTSSFEPAILAEDVVVSSPKSVAESPLHRQESITTLEDTFSLNDNPEHDWPRGQFLENVKTSRDGSIAGKNEAWINRYCLNF